ncbi:hypothetical protein [Methylophaga nitratireducenticrescens]|uniref:hypothetical protein n=1 Tax=Methylophaga nitratireducenticrescens TaxID=754476 RepID=UPI00065750D1|nr:hypothetical protein [Methylophaga nitratireducenticrescens]ASF49140.1 hypothetical protein Q7A_03680 [Methylophaga nitratireducenticrescens]AUZ84996.1 hypothetical protein CDW43_10595 [Methylophaga nitratireducenticrescens]
MDDIELRKEMFAWYGAAMYAAQLFEVELVTLLLGLKRLRDPDTDLDEYDDLDALLSRKTLGALLKELEKHCVLELEFKDMLIGYRDQRNFLAHEFFYARANDMRSREGFERLTEELQEVEHQLRTADQITMKMSENVRKSSGINEESFQAYVQSQLK